MGWGDGITSFVGGGAIIMAHIFKGYFWGWGKNDFLGKISFQEVKRMFSYLHGAKRSLLWPKATGLNGPFVAKCHRPIGPLLVLKTTGPKGPYCGQRPQGTKSLYCGQRPSAHCKRSYTLKILENPSKGIRKNGTLYPDIIVG